MMKEQKKVVVYRVINKDIENSHKLELDSEKMLKTIKNEKSITHDILTEDEYQALKKELADSKSLQEENDALKKELAELKTPKPKGRPKQINT